MSQTTAHAISNALHYESLSSFNFPNSFRLNKTASVDSEIEKAKDLQNQISLVTFA